MKCSLGDVELKQGVLDKGSDEKIGVRWDEKVGMWGVAWNKRGDI